MSFNEEEKKKKINTLDSLLTLLQFNINAYKALGPSATEMGLLQNTGIHVSQIKNNLDALRAQPLEEQPEGEIKRSPKSSSIHL